MKAALRGARLLLADDLRAYLSSGQAERKPLGLQAREAFRLLRYFRYPPYQYLKHGLYLRSSQEEVLDFLPPRPLRAYVEQINPREVVDQVHDKQRFCELMQAAGFPSVPMLASLSREGAIRDVRGRRLSFEELLGELALAGLDRVFLKPRSGANGEGHLVAALEPGALRVEGERLGEAELRRRMFLDRRYDSFLVQPVLRQHPLLGRINPWSVNTVRIDTLVTPERVQVGGALLRMGGGEGFTDNWALGGFITRIELATGELGETAKSKLRHGGRVVRRHPLTGFVFRGTRLPFWSEVPALVCAAARAMRPLRYLGWDVAITDSGPVLIEANHPSDLSMMQEALGGLRPTPLGREWLAQRCRRRPV